MCNTSKLLCALPCASFYISRSSFFFFSVRRLIESKLSTHFSSFFFRTAFSVRRRGVRVACSFLGRLAQMGPLFASCSLLFGWPFFLRGRLRAFSSLCGCVWVCVRIAAHLWRQLCPPPFRSCCATRWGLPWHTSPQREREGR